MTQRINVLCPIETIARELDFRLALAALFARRRYRIFIGHAFAIYRLSRQIKGALLTGKHMMFPNARNPVEYRAAKANGARVVFLGEEGAVFPTDPESLRHNLLYQIEPSQFAPDDYLCTWGDLQREFYLRDAPAPDRVRTTGHPRFDLFRERWRGLYAEEAEALKRRFGDFVLINSNFSWVANPEGMANSFSKEAFGYEVDDIPKRLAFVGAWARLARTLPAYVELVHKLAAARPDVTFVLRPHPTDDVEYYKGVFGGVSNIRVVREGTVAPWLLACRVMIHDGCTTGLEAHLLGRPVVTYVPFPDPEREIYLPNVVGERCTTEQQAIEAVLGALEGREVGLGPVDDYPELARRLFVNFERKECFPGFLEVLEEAAATLSATPAPSDRQLRAAEMASEAVERAKSLVRPLSPRRYRSARMARGKFPGFDRRAIARRLEVMRAITGNPVELRFHSKNLFEIESPRM